jgi:hypothetical protein
MIGEIHMRIPSIQPSCICFSPFSIREEDDARKKNFQQKGKKFLHTMNCGVGLLLLLMTRMSRLSDQSLQISNESLWPKKRGEACDLRRASGADAGFNELDKVSVNLNAASIYSPPCERVTVSLSSTLNGHFLHGDSIAGVGYGQNIFRDH